MENVPSAKYVGKEFMSSGTGSHKVTVACSKEIGLTNDIISSALWGHVGGNINVNNDEYRYC